MDFQKEIKDHSKSKDIKLFNITPNPIEKALNHASIIKTPGKNSKLNLPLLTPNFTINDNSKLDTIVN